MGQQQLLLVIRVTILVGIASAITTFNVSADNANIDVVRNDTACIVANSQSYFYKSPAFGGGGK